MSTITERLEYLRGEIEAGRISWGEIAELQDLADEIDLDDVELLQWAGVPEFHIGDDDPDPEDTRCSQTTCWECRRAEAGRH